MIHFNQEQLEHDGFGLLRSVVPAELIGSACDATETLIGAGLRNPLQEIPALRAIASCDEIRSIAQSLLGPDAMLTRAILFDKTPERNWPVPPHRDTTVAVREKIETPGFGPWSVKAGVVHVRPPDEILAAMWTLRIAIDAAPESNGPLRVLPCSQSRTVPDDSWVTLDCNPGDIVVMRPLILHASNRAAIPSRRRVLHLEWAPRQLPSPLRWADVG